MHGSRPRFQSEVLGGSGDPGKDWGRCMRANGDDTVEVTAAIDSPNCTSLRGCSAAAPLFRDRGRHEGISHGRAWSGGRGAAQLWVGSQSVGLNRILALSPGRCRQDCHIVPAPTQILWTPRCTPSTTMRCCNLSAPAILGSWASPFARSGPMS